MLGLRLEYLTGRAVATRYNDRDTAEWPPHPARLFSALVAAWGEVDPPQDEEQRALEWLEAQLPPRIVCSEAHPRRVVTHFVPVNDPSLLSSALAKYSQQRDATRGLAGQAEHDFSLALDTAELATIKKARKTLGKLAGDIDKADASYGRELANVTAAAPSTAASRATALALLPESRTRQPRAFPSVTPHDPVLYFVWPNAEATAHRAALNALAARLVSLGHSSSLVHARWVDEAPAPTWVPSSTGSQVMRVAAAGQLKHLRDEYSRHQAVEPRVLPFLPQRYAPCQAMDAAPIAETVFSHGDWIVLRRAGGAPLRSTHAAAIAKAARGALMRHLDEPVPELLSGHMQDGQPARAAHMAILGLPHVGHRHADGRIMGVALVFPRETSPAQRRPVIRALARWEQAARTELGAPDDEAPTLTLGLGNGAALEVERIVWGEPGAAALRTDTWCGPAREWLSVTPVALDRNPGNLHSRDPSAARAAADAAARTIAAACERIGLPPPTRVDIVLAGTWAGAALASEFNPYPAAPDKLRKVKVHARLVFQQPVFGPVLIGAGRFHGLGLFRPVSGEPA